MFIVYSIIFGSSLIQGVLGTSDINYSFSKEDYYNDSSITFDEDYNVKKERAFTEHYNGTYSFENEVVGTNGSDIYYIDYSLDEVNTEVKIIENLDGHDKVLELYDNNNSGKAQIYDSHDSHKYGSMELWMRSDDVSSLSQIGLNYLGVNVIVFRIESSKFKTNDGQSGWTNIVDVNNDVWYHVRFSFDLFQAEYNISIDNILYGHFHVLNNETYINRVWIRTNPVHYDYSLYLDAIAYSWNQTVIGKYFDFNDKLVGDDFNTDGYDNFTVSKESGNCDSTIRAYNPLEYEYLELNNTDAVKGLTVNYAFYPQVEGYSIFHFKTNDTYKEYTGFSYGKGSTTVISLGIFFNGLYYFDSGWNRVDDLNNNTWYKVRVNWYSANQTYDLYLDDVKDGNYDYMGTKDSFNFFYIDLPDTYKVSVGVDNIQVNDYEVIGYFINDNFYPYNQPTGYYEVDKTEFRLKDNNELYDVGYDGDIHGWHTYDTIDGSTEIYNDQDSLFHQCIDDFDYQGIYKQNFKQRGYDFINITIEFNVSRFNDVHEDAHILLQVLSSSEHNKVPLTYMIINHTSIGYFDGTRKWNLDSITFNETIRFELMVNCETQKNYLDIYRSGVFDSSHIWDLYTSDVNGLGEIWFYGRTRVDTHEIYFRTYSIGVYVNGRSMSNDLGYFTYDLTGKTWLDSQKYNLFKMDSFGNYSLDSFWGTSYTIEEGINPITDFYNDTLSINIRNGYTNWIFNVFNPSLLFTLKGRADFSLDSIDIEGFYMLEGTSKYWLNYTYSDITDFNQCYFYTLGSKLHFNFTAYESGLEYMKAISNIPDFSAVNYSFRITSDLTGASFSEFRVNYSDDSLTVFDFPAYEETTELFLSQDKTVSSYHLLVSDNNAEGTTNGFTTGYIQSLEANYIPNISWTITTQSIFEATKIIAVLLIPTFIVYMVIKEKLIIPVMLLVMGILAYSLGLIPLWLCFIIILGFIPFLFIREREGL